MFTILLAAAVPLMGCVAIDGDTAKCGTERVRLTAIDSAELPGHCRKGRDCAPGDPYADKASLATMLASGTITIERLGVDHYGRTVGDIYANGQSLSCLQIKSGHARYWKKFDVGGRIRQECGL